MATLTLSSAASPFPFAALATASYTGKAEIAFDASATTPVLDIGGAQVTDEVEIVQALAKDADLSGDSSKVRVCLQARGGADRRSQAAVFFDLAKALSITTAVPELVTSLNTADDHLAFRTFLVGHSITAADWLLWGAIKGMSFPLLLVRILIYSYLYSQATSRSSVS